MIDGFFLSSVAYFSSSHPFSWNFDIPLESIGSRPAEFRPEQLLLSLRFENEHRKCIKRGIAKECRVRNGYIKLLYGITYQKLVVRTMVRDRSYRTMKHIPVCDDLIPLW